MINSKSKYLPYCLAVVFLLVSLFIRPLLPIDETRYVAVAWEMWTRGDFLVPYLNGEPYSHKPPLLFWLMHLGWFFFGVNDWTPRLITPVFSLLTLMLTGRLAKRLWPDRADTVQLSQFILFGFYYWAVNSTLIMFDVMLGFVVLLGIYQLYSIADNGLTLVKWMILAVTVAMGLLTKGPVILLHLLFIVLLAPLWQQTLNKKVNWLHWYSATLGAFLSGIALALCWALSAAMHGGEAYGQAILWGQTSGRIVKSFAHQLPWWWYFKMLPVLLLPWLLWPTLWKGLKNTKEVDAGVKFCLFWFLPVFLTFCLISGKRLHYLLPLLSGLALLLARWADTYAMAPSCWQKSHRPIALIAAVFALGGLIFPILNNQNHWLPWIQPVSPLWMMVLLLTSVVILVKVAGSLTQAAGLLSTLTGVLIITVAGAYFQAAAERHDVGETSKVIAEIQQKGNRLFYLGKYHGEFNFTGRLQKTIRSVNSIAEWELKHPGTYLICRFRQELPKTSGELVFRHADRGRNVAVFKHKSS